ncbi:MAG: hypothetical protein KA133_03875 [Flavobacterium sp.]|nr:hypothetical protein [Flavobacterium sp.]
MKNSIILKDVLPFIIWFSTMIMSAIILDFILHYFDIVFIGLYLGYLGTFTIMISFAYSLKKRKMMRYGTPKVLLDYHEYLALIGSIMILVHAGIHIHSILPWLAILMLIINVASGLIGKYIVQQANQTIKSRKVLLKNSGLSDEEISKKVFWDTITMDAMKKWRTIHLPITYLLGLFSLIHIISVILFN